MLAVGHAHCIKLAGSSAFLLTGLFLLLRRLNGRMGQPLSAESSAAIAIAIVAGVHFLRTASRCRKNRQTSGNLRSAIAAEIALALGMLSLGASILLPAAGCPASPIAVSAYWSIVLTSESMWWAWCWIRRRRTVPNPLPREVRPALPAGESSRPAITEEPNQEFPHDVSQQITRGVCDGVEMVFGRLRGHFAPGQQHKNLHVAFCPPLAATPHITVGAIEGPKATITVGESQNYGARFELRLAALPDQTCSVAIEFYAQPVS